MESMIRGLRLAPRIRPSARDGAPRYTHRKLHMHLKKHVRTIGASQHGAVQLCRTVHGELVAVSASRGASSGNASCRRCTSSRPCPLTSTSCGTWASPRPRRASTLCRGRPLRAAPAARSLVRGPTSRARRAPSRTCTATRRRPSRSQAREYRLGQERRAARD
jgi:hypothetical protein